MKISTRSAWSGSEPPPGHRGARVQTGYVLEVGGAFISYRLLDEAAARLPGVWAIISRFALPVLLILAWRRCAGQAWRIRDIGIAKPIAYGWLEGLWLLAFQTACLLGVILAVARLRFYGLLDFLVGARSRLNGYPAEYGTFVFALALFCLMHLAWGGELFCRGMAQGLGTIRSNAAAGAVASWLASGAAAASLALRLGYPPIPVACLWGLFALFPGPVCEAFYLRNRSILPLMAIRTASTSLGVAGAGFFLYWYPDRSFSAALPLAWASLLSLLLISGAGARRLLPFWRTAAAIVRVGIVRGAPPGMGLAAIVIAEGCVRAPAVRLGSCVTILIVVLLLRTGGGGSVRTETTSSASASM